MSSVSFNPDTWNPETELLGLFRNTYGQFTYNQEGSNKQYYFKLKHNSISLSTYHFRCDVFQEIPEEAFIIGFLYSSGDIQFMVTGKSEEKDGDNLEVAIEREIKEELATNYKTTGVKVNEKRADPDFTFGLKNNSFNRNRMKLVKNSYCKIIKTIKTNQEAVASNYREPLDKTRVRVGSYLYLNSAFDVIDFFTYIGPCLSKTDPAIVGICAVKVKLIKKRLERMFATR